MRTASWVIKNKKTGEIILETFNPKVIAALNTAKYEAVPIRKHLEDLNESLKVKKNPAKKGSAAMRAHLAQLRAMRKTKRNPRKKVTKKNPAKSRHNIPASKINVHKVYVIWARWTKNIDFNPKQHWDEFYGAFNKRNPMDATHYTTLEQAKKKADSLARRMKANVEIGVDDYHPKT